jgi:hypothetical protein
MVLVLCAFVDQWGCRIRERSPPKNPLHCVVLFTPSIDFLDALGRMMAKGEKQVRIEAGRPPGVLRPTNRINAIAMRGQ